MDFKPPRTSPRIIAKAPVQLSATDDSGQSIQIGGFTLNLSRSGVCLQVEREIALNTLVTIHWQDNRGDHQAQARLLWKQRQGNQWRVGLIEQEDRHLWAKFIYFACQFSDTTL